MARKNDYAELVGGHACSMVYFKGRVLGKGRELETSVREKGESHILKDRLLTLSCRGNDRYFL